MTFFRASGIVIESWSPFKNGGILRNPVLVSLAKKYAESVASIIQAWLKSKGVIPIIKASNKTHMEMNLSTSRELIKLLEEDIQLIDSLHDDNAHTDYWNYKRQLRY